MRIINVCMGYMLEAEHRQGYKIAKIQRIKGQEVRPDQRGVQGGLQGLCGRQLSASEVGGPRGVVSQRQAGQQPRDRDVAKACTAVKHPSQIDISAHFWPWKAAPPCAGWHVRQRSRLTCNTAGEAVYRGQYQPQVHSQDDAKLSEGEKEGRREASLLT